MWAALSVAEREEKIWMTNWGLFMRKALVSVSMLDHSNSLTWGFVIQSTVFLSPPGSMTSFTRLVMLDTCRLSSSLRSAFSLAACSSLCCLSFASCSSFLRFSSFCFSVSSSLSFASCSAFLTSPSVGGTSPPFLGAASAPEPLCGFPPTSPPARSVPLPLCSAASQLARPTSVLPRCSFGWLACCCCWSACSVCSPSGSSSL
mmetsp:Transcript_8328/g.23393  ORF Transcript_8328/g.23393 Transcript_8328/m.23393 type:complete len:203 (-) Transcript_8328:970-1578(-)